MSFSRSPALLATLRRPLAAALALCALALAAPSPAPAQLLAPPAAARANTDWTRSLVTVEATYKVRDAFQPWNEPTRSIRKHGLVIGPGEVLTTAQYLPDHTLVRLQKGGRGRWYDARVKWWDAQSNLALLACDAPDFWAGLAPAPLAETVSRGPEFDLVRWRDGNLETRRVEFGQFTVSDGVLGFASHVQLEVSTDLGGLGWTEPVARDGRVVGLTAFSSGRTCGVIPAGFIRRVLAAYRSGEYKGLGVFDFTWQPGRNPEVLRALGLDGAPRGGVVFAPGAETDPEKAPQARDVLLEIDGRAIDGEGDYLDPDYGHLMLEYLANRAHFAGDTIKIRLRRGAEEKTIDYVVPRADYADDVVPRELFGAPPAYLVAGGLVFQPLSQPFLRGWGDEWRSRAPFRLQYHQFEEPADGRAALVVLSGVLPDPINLGYEDAAMLVVDKVNGRPIATLAELDAALKETPEGGAHRIEFMRGRNLQRLLLDSATLTEATERVVKYYGLPRAARF